MKYKVIIDTREKKPFSLAGLDTIRQGLRVGDYSIMGFQDIVGIERKSMMDFYFTFGSGYQRFCSEMKSINEMPFGYMIVEAPLEKCLTAYRKSKKLKPELSNLVKMNWQDFKARFPNVSVEFARSRADADKFTVELLNNIIQKLNQMNEGE